jgi:ectoine hydroxylase-related dioxygenase (phytanoyl-CoA dioxygenase family)
MSELDDVVGRLDQDGYAILTGLLDERHQQELIDALAPWESARPMGRNAFEGLRTQRVYSLAGKGEVFMRLAEHPAIVEIVDRTLLPNWLLSTFQSIRLHPGETAQAWHTDDAFYLIPRPRRSLALSTIWALEAFTEENGATQVIPGSHKWGDEHPDHRPERAVSVVMPAGSVVVFDAALWHRGGANQSGSTRLALSPQYCQPWLRPQESQLLIIPPERAAALTPRGRAMMGYSIFPPFIGQVDGMNPIRLIDSEYHSDNRAHLSREAELADYFLKRPGR